MKKPKCNDAIVSCDDMSAQLTTNLDGLLKAQDFIGAALSFASSEYEAFERKEL